MRFSGWMMAGAVLVLTGCAQTTERSDEERKNDREYRRLDFEHRFVDYEARCRQAGGRMVIYASSRLPRSGVPQRGDYFNCTTRIGSVPRS